MPFIQVEIDDETKEIFEKIADKEVRSAKGQLKYMILEEVDKYKKEEAKKVS